MTHEARVPCCSRRCWSQLDSAYMRMCYTYICICIYSVYMKTPHSPLLVLLQHSCLSVFHLFLSAPGDTTRVLRFQNGVSRHPVADQLKQPFQGTSQGAQSLLAWCRFWHCSWDRMQRATLFPDVQLYASLTATVLEISSRDDSGVKTCGRVVATLIT